MEPGADLERKEEVARFKLSKNPFSAAVRVTTWEGKQEKLCVWRIVLCSGRNLLCRGYEWCLSPACGCSMEA